MNELDEIWSRMLADAEIKARGNQDIVSYLQLKASNDAIRRGGVEWLFESFIEAAGEAMRGRFGINITREEPHNFSRGASNMVGTLLEIRQGVRCLSVEAGWTRTPADGIMQKGALAYARVRHFGMPKAGAELKLAKGNEMPNWLDEKDEPIDSSFVVRHIGILLGE